MGSKVLHDSVPVSPVNPQPGQSFHAVCAAHPPASVSVLRHRARPRMVEFLAVVLLATMLSIGGNTVANAAGTPPAVGCAEEGMTGPIPAPTTIEHVPTIVPWAADRLAYYASSDLGVLAPRGWHCYGGNGSEGEVLIVTPGPIGPENFQSVADKGVRGPAVEVEQTLGSTSGRFEVAQVIARLFPDYQRFVVNVVKEGLMPASDFPPGPYPNDMLVQRSPTDVWFRTPGGATGMGTQSILDKGQRPITGAAMLSPSTMNLAEVIFKLPKADTDLDWAIITEWEQIAGTR